ncbi:MAG: hypothetical protein AAF221_12445 [Pseudomonadota bacterium]
MGPLKAFAGGLCVFIVAGGVLGVADRAPEGSFGVAKPVFAEVQPVARQRLGARQIAYQPPTLPTQPAPLPVTFQPSKLQAAAKNSVFIDTAFAVLDSFDLAPTRRQESQPIRSADARASRIDRWQLAFLPGPKRRPKKPASYDDAHFAKQAAHIAPAAARPSNQTFALNAAGYEALARGDAAQALSYFARSIAQAPEQPSVHSQIGYLEKARGNYASARTAFETASAFGRVQPSIARELSQLSRPLRLSAYTVWRENSRQINDAAFGPSLAQSQSGLGATYQLPFNGRASLHGLSLTSRVLWAYEPESLSPDGRTTQAGIGMQVRPFQTLNLIAGAERLIAIGDDARSDWLLRTSYSAGRGYEPEPGEDWWLHWSGYVDAALIDPADPDIQVLADARVGMGTQPLARSSLSVIPFIGLSGSYEDAGGRTTDLYEAAAGVWLRLWPGGPEITDPARALDLRLEYREKLGGDSPSSSGLRLTFGVTY